MTRIDEIAPNIFRIASDVDLPGDMAFSFNQYLVAAERPMLWHTGPRRLFEQTRGAIARVMDPARLAFVGFSHFEADECGALNEFLSVAPDAAPVCGAIGAMVSISDVADRAPRALAHGETLDLGGARLTWFDTPHMPHGWDCGMMFDETSRTLFSGDLFTMGGKGHAPVTEQDVLEPSEAFRGPLDYYAHAPGTRAKLNELADLKPTTLALMHGPAWKGEGAALLRELGARVG